MTEFLSHSTMDFSDTLGNWNNVDLRTDLIDFDDDELSAAYNLTPIQNTE